MIFKLFNRSKNPPAPAPTIEEVVRNFIKEPFQPRSLEILNSEISRLEQLDLNTLGIEADTKDDLTAQIRALRAEANLVELVAAEITLSVLDIRFLQYLKRCPEGALPAYAVFEVDDPRCALAVPAKSRRNLLYKHGDLSTLMKAAQNRRALAIVLAFDEDEERACTTVAIGTSFTYQLPSVVRSCVNSLKPVADDIYIITDAPDWRLNKMVPLVAPHAITVAKIGELFLMIGPAWTPLPIKFAHDACATGSIG